VKLHNFTNIIQNYDIPKENTFNILDILERNYIHRHINSNNAITMAMTGAKRLREMLKKEDHIVVAPGVYDGLSARIALAAGAEVLYMVRLQSLKALPL
jgi:NurA-like 5'-3' nuclease